MRDLANFLETTDRQSRSDFLFAELDRLLLHRRVLRELPCLRTLRVSCYLSSDHLLINTFLSQEAYRVQWARNYTMPLPEGPRGFPTRHAVVIRQRSSPFDLRKNHEP